MRTITVVLALVVAASAESLSSSFAQFKQKHGKHYSSGEEEMHRMRIFASNLKKFELHNAEAARGLHSYTMGVNQFADLTEKEFEDIYLKGFIPKPDRPRRTAMLTNVTMPDEVNWVKQGYVSSVKDQGTCGSCWAFAAAGALEAAIVKSSGNLTSFSPQCFVDCVTQCSGCDGGHFYYAFSWAKRNNVATEEQYPYVGQNGQCRQMTSQARVEYIVDIGGGEYGLAIKIAEDGPAAAGIYANPLQYYDQGIFDGICYGVPNHAVLIVGYGSEGGKDYWLIKNSWSESWGEEGYIRLARNAGNLCGIADDVEYVITA